MICQGSSRQGPTTSTVDKGAFQMRLGKIDGGAKQDSRDKGSLPPLLDPLAGYYRLLVTVVAMVAVIAAFAAFAKVVMVEALTIRLALKPPLRAAMLAEGWAWDFWVAYDSSIAFLHPLDPPLGCLARSSTLRALLVQL